MPITATKTHPVIYSVSNPEGTIKIKWKVFDQAGSAMEIYVQLKLIFPKTVEEKTRATASAGEVILGNFNNLHDKIIDCCFEIDNRNDSPTISFDFSIEGGPEIYTNANESWSLFNPPTNPETFRVRILLKKS